MCLGVPGKVIELHDAGGLKMGTVDFGGVRREACLEYVPQVEVGQYVIIHVGFAISVLNEDEAMETLALLEEITNIEDEFNPGSENQSTHE
jgi:hydrogenase expression/formation protein HypC